MVPAGRLSEQVAQLCCVLCAAGEMRKLGVLLKVKVKCGDARRIAALIDQDRACPSWQPLSHALSHRGLIRSACNVSSPPPAPNTQWERTHTPVSDW